MAMHNFLPHTEAERQAMLKTIGVERVDDLFSDIPASLRENMQYQSLPAQGLSEADLQRELATWSHLNAAERLTCFLGGGAYSRFIPMVVNTIASRSEFYTAYTPYQPEIAQGTLQVTYEFQTMICELTGMDVANASVYDGASAVTEAALMALRATRRHRVLVAKTVNPDYLKVLKTYFYGLGESELVLFNPEEPGDMLNPETVEARKTACVILQVPNYFGGLEATTPIQDFCRQTGALFIVSADPISLGLLKAPGSYGADIVVGDIQPLGNNLSFGGPYGGYIASLNKYMRQLPGRLVGRTVDRNGKQCYTLTLQTREQHIRREKATSNICTNQALNILKATVYLSLIGPAGLKHLANLSVQRAHILANRLKKLPGVIAYVQGQPFFFEFALRFPVPVQPLLAHLEKQGILGGIALERFYPEAKNALLITCTETTLPEDIDRYVCAVEQHLRLATPKLFPPLSNPTELKSQMEATC
jgi:glycine dehydrogenase subunit 1